MAKYGNTHYYEAPRIFWPRSIKKKGRDKKNHLNIYEPVYPDDKYLKYHSISVLSKWLYQTLKECEHRYTGSRNTTTTAVFHGIDNTENWFYAGTGKLVYMSGMSKSSVKKSIAELNGAGLIHTCDVTLYRNGKMICEHISGYRVLGETEIVWQEIESDDDDYE